MSGEHSLEEGDGGMSGEEGSIDREMMYSSKKGGLQHSEKHRPQDVSLGVEHKIFFNEYYKNEYERNKLTMLKHDKRK